MILKGAALTILFTKTGITSMRDIDILVNHRRPSHGLRASSQTVTMTAKSPAVLRWNVSGEWILKRAQADLLKNRMDVWPGISVCRRIKVEEFRLKGEGDRHWRD